MNKCRKCGCMCDPGDIVGGVCDDCREEEKSLEIRKEWNRMMRDRNIKQQKDGQMVICM